MKVILIHGNGGGTSNDHWFPYVKQELEAIGLTVIARDFPDNDLARKEYWLPFLKDVLVADEESILIGHSSGAVAAMRYAEHNKIKGSVLVGACYTDMGDAHEKASGYYDTPWDWETIRKNQEWIVQFASTDDPWIPIAEARLINEKLHTDYIEYTDREHFGLNKPMTEFPELVAKVKQKLSPS